MSSSAITSTHFQSSLGHDSAHKGEPCQGVIKKLFPAKRYGFLVLECCEHTGEAHFNYSDLLLDEKDRSHLCVGWRLNFNIVSQERVTPHCVYRAQLVRPFHVMVVQCELSDSTRDLLGFTSAEIGNKMIYCTRECFNGKTDGAASRETCRAAISWNEIKKAHPLASHCSQDTPTVREMSSALNRSGHSLHKTPDRKPLRREQTPVHGSSPSSTSSNTKNVMTSSQADHTTGKAYPLGTAESAPGRSVRSGMSNGRRVEDLDPAYSPRATSTPKDPRNFTPFFEPPPRVFETASNTKDTQPENEPSKSGWPLSQGISQNPWNSVSLPLPRNLCNELRSFENQREDVRDMGMPASKASYPSLENMFGYLTSPMIDSGLADNISRGLGLNFAVPSEDRLTSSSMGGIGHYDTNSNSTVTQRSQRGGTRFSVPSPTSSPLSGLNFPLTQQQQQQRSETPPYDSFLEASSRNFPVKTSLANYRARVDGSPVMSQEEFSALIERMKDCHSESGRERMEQNPPSTS